MNDDQIITAVKRATAGFGASVLAVYRGASEDGRSYVAVAWARAGSPFPDRPEGTHRGHVETKGNGVVAASLYWGDPDLKVGTAVREARRREAHARLIWMRETPATEEGSS